MKTGSFLILSLLLTGAIVMVPTDGDDTIVGTEQADTIDALGGDDHVSGRGGNDDLSGSAGNDILYGDDGDDLLNGGIGDDVLVPGNGNDIAVGGAGANRFYISADDAPSNSSLPTAVVSYSNPIEDRVFLDLLAFGGGLPRTAANRWDASAWNATVSISPAFDLRCTFSNGNFIDVAPALGDFLTGDLGIVIEDIRFQDLDELGLPTDDEFIGTAFSDIMYGGAGSDSLHGKEGDDELFGGSGADLLIGGQGDDLLVLGSGDDEARGGAGRDVYRLAATEIGRNTIIDSGLPEDPRGWGGDYIQMQGTVVNGFSNLVIRDGKRFQTKLRGWDLMFDGYDLRIGSDSNHILIKNFDNSTNPFGIVLTEFVRFGQDGDDTILGTSGHDNLGGRGGRDHLIGGAGCDLLVGGDGDDHLEGGDDNDQLVGHAGNDLLEAGEGRDVLNGREGDDELYGGRGNDRLTGDEGHDFLQGDSGIDALYGDDGNDRLYGDSQAEGWVSVDGDLLDDFLYGGSGSDLLDGGPGDDYLDGGAGPDLLIGSTGNDVLRGGSGGMQGTDGVARDDRFLFAGAAFGTDVIEDFEDGRDIIWLDVPGIEVFEDLILEQTGSGVTLNFPLGILGVIKLDGVSPAMLDAADFHFGGAR